MEDKMPRRATNWLKLVTKSDDGVTAIEYSLIGGLISVFIIVALSLVGGEVNTTFNTWTNAVHTAVQSSQGS
jgi:Flp pilus assembly pilin Flp